MNDLDSLTDLEKQHFSKLSNKFEQNENNRSNKED